MPFGTTAASLFSLDRIMPPSFTQLAKTTPTSNRLRLTPHILFFSWRFKWALGTNGPNHNGLKDKAAGGTRIAPYFQMCTESPRIVGF